jgi:hypothetical protein
MASNKPLTAFLLALAHSPELTAAYNDPDLRPGLLESWGLGGNELLAGGNPTLDDVKAALAAEHEGEKQSVDVAWWIWFFGGPR